MKSSIAASFLVAVVAVLFFGAVGSLYVAAGLLLVLSIGHSYLGERYILIRLFRRDNLPRLFGSTEFTVRTLRFAWHVTSLAWCGFAALLLFLAHPPITAEQLGTVIAATFVATGVVALLGSRGKHLSWPIFLAIGVLAFYATQSS